MLQIINHRQSVEYFWKRYVILDNQKKIASLIYHNLVWTWTRTYFLQKFDIQRPNTAPEALEF